MILEPHLREIFAKPKIGSNMAWAPIMANNNVAITATVQVLKSVTRFYF